MIVLTEVLQFCYVLACLPNILSKAWLMVNSNLNQLINEYLNEMIRLINHNLLILLKFLPWLIKYLEPRKVWQDAKLQWLKVVCLEPLVRAIKSAISFKKNRPLFRNLQLTIWSSNMAGQKSRDQCCLILLWFCPCWPMDFHLKQLLFRLKTDLPLTSPESADSPRVCSISKWKERKKGTSVWCLISQEADTTSLKVRTCWQP